MLVSVVIPCYNVEQYIEECIQSVISQTYKSIEIICIDNNSTDNTYQTLIQLKEKYSHLIIDKELKEGACAARNKGLLLSIGEWIQFLDADDLLLPNKIEHQVELVRSSSKNIAFIAAAFKRRSLQGIDSEIIVLNSIKSIAPFINQCGNTCSNFWNKKALIEIGAWNEKLKSSQETDLMLRLVLSNNDFTLDLKPFTIIRERISGQISQRNPKEKWCQYVDVRIRYLNELKQRYFESYNQNKKSFYKFLLISLSILATYDINSALKRYNSYVKKEVDVFDLKFAFIKLFGFNLYLKLKFILKNIKD